jgi:hypothetical protein
VAPRAGARHFAGLAAGDRLADGPDLVPPSRGFCEIAMCRNIKTLYNFKPPATDEEMRASALQFVRKLSGFARPSKANQLAFDRAVDEVTKAAQHLLGSLVTATPPRDRENEASKARARAADRFHVEGRQTSSDTNQTDGSHIP